MKKHLLLFSAAGMLAVQGLSAQESEAPKNYMIPNFYAWSISPDGTFALSSDLFTGGLITWNLNENAVGVALDPADYGCEFLSPANGNGMGNGNVFTGTVSLGSTDVPFIYNGKETELIEIDNMSTAATEGMTPDATQMCGYYGEPGIFSLVLPVYWSKVDGKWAPTKLPVPATDFMGLSYQGINAVSISDDGNVIVGDIVDDHGWCPQPIAWLRDGEGKWTYKTLGMDIINPDGVEIPECPVAPDPFEYMTAEEKQEYEADYQAYRDEISSGNLAAERPDPIDYMDNADKKAAYQAALTEYNQKMNLLETAYVKILDSGSTFEMNQIYTSPNGKYLGCTASRYNAETDTDEHRACIFNLEDGTSRLFENAGFIHQVYDDGSAISFDPIDFFGGMPYQHAYYIPEDGSNAMPMFFQDYVKTRNEEAYKFVTENLAHNYSTYEYNEETEEYEEVVKTGLIAMGSISMTPDKTRVVGSQMAAWIPEEGQSEETMFFGYTLELAKKVAIDDILTDGNADAEAAPEYFNMQGIRISQPAAGQIVIRRQGDKVTKIIAQ